MVRVFPIRKDQLDDQISNFPLTNASHRLYSVFAFLPLDGTITQDIWAKRLEYDHEITTPYYYSTLLGGSGNQLEFSPQKRSGYFRIHFVGNKKHFLRIGVFSGLGEIKSQDKRVISKIEEFSGMKAYFYAETDNDIQEVQYQNPIDQKWVLLGVGEQPKQSFLPLWHFIHQY